MLHDVHVHIMGYWHLNMYLLWKPYHFVFLVMWQQHMTPH